MNHTETQNTTVHGHPAASERFSADELQEIMSGFAKRLVEAFDGANNNEIARKCNTTNATIRQYTEGKRLPIAEMLLHMSRVTGVSTQWLLTGRGPKWVSAANDLFDAEEEATIRQMAKASGRTFGEQVRVLVKAAVEFLQRTN
jgi:transcriptional regulator with XRE-family HTH domain